MEKKILIRRILVQVDNGKVYYTSAFDYKLMYTTQSVDDLTRHQKIINMPQLMSLYKHIPNAEYSKTLFGKKDKIIISYVGGETCFFNTISITEKFFKKHTLTIHFEYKPYDMTLKDVINTFDMNTAIEIISDRIGKKINQKTIEKLL